jgi:hypothetical protein
MYVVENNNQMYGPFATHELALYWARSNTYLDHYTIHILYSVK